LRIPANYRNAVVENTQLRRTFLNKALRSETLQTTVTPTNYKAGIFYGINN
jgi:hypothetical protein